MKTKQLFTIAFLLVFLVPFNYAYLNPTASNTVNILCFLAVAFGTLLLLIINLSRKTEKN